jgi:hypothetical protein
MALQDIIREILANEFNENLVQRAPSFDIQEPAKAYVDLQRMVGLHGTPTSDGLTLHMKKPVGDIVAVTLQKDGGIYDLVAVKADGATRRLGADSFYDPDKVAELRALHGSLSEN